LNKFANISIRLLPLLLLFVLHVASASGQVTPTNEWVSFFSENTTLNGNPIPVGALIDAYDPDGIHCGRDTVHTVGHYGFFPVYRDDIYTSGIDEGAAPDDTITIYINGVEATTTGPADPVWTSAFAMLRVDLTVDIDFDVNVPDPLDGSGEPGQSVDYVFTVQNTGEGIDFYELDVISATGWAVEILGSSTTDYVYPASSTTVSVRVHIPADAPMHYIDDVTLTATSAMDSGVFSSGVVSTEVVTTSASDFDPFIPGIFKLSQNYPNPFNPSTTIQYTLERSANVELCVYNVIGQKIRTLTQGSYPVGTYEVEWDGTDESGSRVASGIYFYRLTAGDHSRTCKMMLMK